MFGFTLGFATLTLASCLIKLGRNDRTLFNNSSLLSWAWSYETPEGSGSTEGAQEALTRHSDQTTARKCSLVGDTFETHIYSGAYTA